MIEEGNAVDPLSLVTPIEEYSLSYRILKESDKTSDIFLHPRTILFVIVGNEFKLNE